MLTGCVSKGVCVRVWGMKLDEVAKLCSGSAGQRWRGRCDATYGRGLLERGRVEVDVASEEAPAKRTVIYKGDDVIAAKHGGRGLVAQASGALPS